MKTLAKWSVQDYHSMISTGIFRDRRLELLGGEIIEMSPEIPLHYYQAQSNVDYLQSLLKNKAHVRFNGPITLLDSEPEPDLAIVKNPKERYIHHHPNNEEIFWLIEVSQSTLAYDISDKKKTYARNKIEEYWVIDLKKSQLYVFRNPLEEDYKIESIVTEGILTPLAFPNVEIAVNKLLLDSD
ncbi:MAG: Uma2 family endonuclease [Moorea sp. SIO2B7]|nr:Uma2 family endonuclease [Moorena sp. SIO2B7]